MRAQAEGAGIIRWIAEKFEFKIPLHKVQMLEGSSSVLQRLVGFETFKVHQARPIGPRRGQHGIPVGIIMLSLNAMLFPFFGAEVRSPPADAHSHAVVRAPS